MAHALQLGPATIVWTGTAEGPLGHNPPRRAHDDACCGSEAMRRRDSVRAGEWLRLQQVHGDDVVVATDYSAIDSEADAAVTAEPELTLAIATADCAPLALVSAEGIVGAVHAGWKGLRNGVIEAAVDEMRALGATDIEGALGPCIHGECYEFAGSQLDELVAHWGEGVRSVTSQGTPGLDLPEAVRIVCEQVGVELLHEDEACTMCSGEHYSYRNGDTDDRQVMLVWRNA